MAQKTFYPDANPESTSFDGSCLSAANATWSTVRSASASEFASSSSATFSVEAYLSGGVYRINRAFLLFDTSPIRNGAQISSATLSIYKNDTAIQNADTSSACLVASTPASDTDLVVGDYDQVGTTRLATDIAYSTISTGAYFTFTLNATGIAAISKTGITKFGVRDKRDLDNSAPTGSNSITCVSADSATNKPYLTVNYGGGMIFFNAI